MGNHIARFGATAALPREREGKATGGYVGRLWLMMVVVWFVFCVLCLLG